MSERTYAIIGTGALGGYYGARLACADVPVHFLLHSDFAHVKAHGLRVESPEGDFSVQKPSVSAQPEDMPRCDVVMVCLKSTANHLLKKILPHVLADDGVVVMMQNGLGVEDEAAAIVGPDRVMGGLAFLCSNKVGPGHIQHLNYGQIRIGDYDPAGRVKGVTPRARAFGDDLVRAGLPVVLEDDLILARWKKLVWNVPYNGLTVALNTTTDRLMHDPHTRKTCEALMREVQQGAAAFDRTIDEAHVQKMLDDTDKMVPYRPSMKLDYDEKRPMEVEAIYGAPLRAAASKGVHLPRMAMLYEQLKFLDAANRPLV
ncbi:MAG: putative 2-dehydropantoate 2-reductase [Planctomycetes bacterium]|nr:putative 2-dehydropantoate 2-reductase [Planctomycetota bacterium]